MRAAMVGKIKDVDFLETIATKRNVSVASLVRNAVAAYVQRQKKR